MRAGLSLLFLLLCLLGSCTLEVQASEGGDTKACDSLPYKKHPLDPDTTADQFDHQTSASRDVWAELRLLRDMVVEQKVELRNLEGRLRDMETQAEEQKMDLLLTKISLEELKRDHTATEERLRSSEKQVEEVKDVNVVLRDELEKQAAELLSVEARVAVSDSELQLLTLKVDDLQAQSTAQDVDLTSVMDRMNTTERRVDRLIKESAKVAFYSALTNSEGLGPHNTPTVLKFSKVFTNVGNAYSPTTGFFTAPLKGVYYLRFTICGHTNDGRMGVQLFHNGKSIVFNLQSKHKEYFEYLSNAVILELDVGDELHLVLPENSAIFDNVNNHSTFSGFLLFSV